jgi:pantetheine-phosphate adenylyltransferase
MKANIAVFPGSFDPITLGHVAIVEKALPLFDEIIIAIGENSNKNYYFSLEERLQHLKAAFGQFSKVKVETYKGLTVEFCKQKNARFIVRGLRDGKDFEYEKSIAIMNSQMKTGVETLFFMTNAEYSAINSFIVRDILKNQGDASAFLPMEVNQLITKK